MISKLFPLSRESHGLARTLVLTSNSATLSCAASSRPAFGATWLQGDNSALYKSTLRNRVALGDCDIQPGLPLRHPFPVRLQEQMGNTTLSLDLGKPSSPIVTMRAFSLSSSPNLSLQADSSTQAAAGQALASRPASRPPVRRGSRLLPFRLPSLNTTTTVASVEQALAVSSSKDWARSVARSEISVVGKMTDAGKQGYLRPAIFRQGCLCRWHGPECPKCTRFCVQRFPVCPRQDGQNNQQTTTGRVLQWSRILQVPRVRPH